MFKCFDELKEAYEKKKNLKPKNSVRPIPSGVQESVTAFLVYASCQECWCVMTMSFFSKWLLTHI